MFILGTAYQGCFEIFGNSFSKLLSFYFEEKVTQIIKCRGAGGLSVKKTWRFICIPFFFFKHPIMCYVAATGLTTAVRWSSV